MGRLVPSSWPGHGGVHWVRDELSTGQPPLPEVQDIFLAVTLRRLATLVEQTEA